MGWLKDAILGIVGGIKDFAWAMTIGGKIEMLKAINDRDALEVAYLAIPMPLRMLPEVVQIYNEKVRELEDPGNFSPFAGIAPAMYEGCVKLIDMMSDAAGSAIGSSYIAMFETMTGQPLSSDVKKKLGGTSVPDAFEGILDSILSVSMLPFDKGAEAMGKEIPEEAKEAIQEMIKLSAGLGGTIGLGGYIMEHFHPTKGTNAARSLNMILELVGYKTLRDAYLKPLRWQLIEQPMRYKWNTLIHGSIPTQGEITGLARKYEITSEEYTEAMLKSGVDTFWIQKLLQGFWADPRLFEIIRLMEVERPTEIPHPDAVVWLTKAGLEGFIGPDWWLAMKFGKAGYDKIDIPILVSAVKARNIQRELGDIRMMQRKQYIGGEVTRAEYEALLKLRGIGAAEAKALLDATDTELKMKYRSDYQRAYEQKYGYNRITIEELTKNLLKLGLKKEYVTARVEYLSTKKEGKLAIDEEAKVLTDAKIVNAYKYGQKQKGWAMKQLDDKGWSTEDAVLLAESVDQDIKNDTIAEWIRTYESRTLYFRMSIEELKAKYVELGKTEEWAEARAAYMEERLMGKEEVEE